MAIRGVFHAVPPHVFGARIRTTDDIARFVRGEHPIRAARTLDVADAWACLGGLCAHFALPRVMGIQSVRGADCLSTLYVPAYRVPAIAEALEQVGPGQLAEGMSALAQHPPADGRAWLQDQRALALQFLQLKKFYRDCATDGCDILFVKRKGAPGPSSD